MLLCYLCTKMDRNRTCTQKTTKIAYQQCLKSPNFPPDFHPCCTIKEGHFFIRGRRLWRKKNSQQKTHKNNLASKTKKESPQPAKREQRHHTETRKAALFIKPFFHHLQNHPLKLTLMTCRQKFQTRKNSKDLELQPSLILQNSFLCH